MRPLRILGPFPPPYGGVAIHCVRLLESLRERGIVAKGISLGGLPASLQSVVLLRPWMVLSRGPVHYHTDEGNFRWMLMLSTLWRLTRIPYIVTLHSFRHRAEFENVATRDRLRRAYEHAEAVIAISDDVAAAVEHELGLRHKRLKIIASNLPISAWERQAPLPDELPNSWRKAEIRLLANAGAVTSFNGNDLYGIDVLLEAFAMLSDQRISLCIVVGGVRDKQLADRLLKQASTDARVCIVYEPNSALVPVVEHSHVIVRPTRTEGGPSLTVTEAMELGKITIASDAVARPAGCITFRNEDPADLARVLEHSIEEVRSAAMPEPVQAYSSALTQLVHLYQKLGFVENS
jgi:glycosyltransferase involved in cell wall biosynthesis